MSISAGKWWLQFDRIILFAFAVGTGVLTGPNQQRALGVAMVLTLIALSIFSRGSNRVVGKGVPPELVCYTLWVVWAFASGYFVVTQMPYFIFHCKLIAQMLVMVWAVYGMLRNKMTPQVVFLAIALAGLIQIGSVIIGTTEWVEPDPNEQVMGIAGNPNTFGMFLTLTTICVMQFWRTRIQTPFVTLRKFAILGVIIVCGYMIALSGSRKSILIYAIVVSLWPLFVLPTSKKGGAMLVRLVAAAILVIAMGMAVPYVMENTSSGQRWRHLVEVEGRGHIEEGIKSNLRYEMYVQGLQMFRSSPITGVGLGHFMVNFFTHQYSHSDYIEPLATTGAVGFLLYQSFYVILMVRLRAILRRARDQIERYEIKNMILGMVAILLYGLGGPHFGSQMVFLYLALLSAYTFTIMQEQRAGVDVVLARQGKLANKRPVPRAYR